MVSISSALTAFEITQHDDGRNAKQKRSKEKILRYAQNDIYSGQ